jgi:hypothetical protein
MARVIFFVMVMVIAVSSTLMLHRCSDQRVEVDSTARMESLADGSVLIAPDGSISSVLIDWLRGPAAKRRRFEVGGKQYAPGATAPTPEAKLRLARLAQMLRAYPGVHLSLIGATSPSGNAGNDQRLSEARARLCADLLVAAGIDRSRIAVSGEGGAHPRYAPDSPMVSHNDRIVLELYKPA